ncbi:MAG: spermine/spermidine synthase [Deltaproteobacteria bacterium]|nr:spermine/spermidine synthase [Deltaproteobacteria bacterium]
MAAKMREVLERRYTKRGEIQLQRRDGGIYEIIYNGTFLMASYNNRSEKVLARSALERLRPKTDGYQILVGGLGMGFTLQEALSSPRVSRVSVTEIEEAVIHWNQRYFQDLNGKVLEDPRTVLIHSDLFDFLNETEERFDAVLIDVDNGPGWLVLEKNRRLYTEQGLRRIRDVLTPNGVVSTWAEKEDREYWRRLNSVFHQAEKIKVRESSPAKGESLIYVAIASG